jgi:hypothetical protein
VRLGAGVATAQDYSARLCGCLETAPATAPQRGDIRKNGTDTFALDVKNSAAYTLTFSGLSSHVTQAHIHLVKCTWLVRSLSSFART